MRHRRRVYRVASKARRPGPPAGRNVLVDYQKVNSPPWRNARADFKRKKLHTMDLKYLPPSGISTDEYWNSPFQNKECEIIMRNIVLLQRAANPEKWTPFTWGDYVKFCTHGVTISEKMVIDAFVNGGRPAWNSDNHITPGWLAFDEKSEEYMVAPKMVDLLASYYSAK